MFVRLVLDVDPQILTVRSYAPGAIEVAGEHLAAPFILSPSQLIRNWPVRSAAELDAAAMEPLLALQPQVVLIGADSAAPSGSTWRQPALARMVAVEFMNLGAACRTYNVLAQERRAVVAGFIP